MSAVGLYNIVMENMKLNGDGLYCKSVNPKLCYVILYTPVNVHLKRSETKQS